MLANALSEAFETGRHYEFNATNTNKHTPFLEPIKSSNLCVTGDTMVSIKLCDVNSAISMKELVERFPLRKETSFYKWCD